MVGKLWASDPTLSRPLLHSNILFSCLSPLNTATPLDCEVSLWSSWGLCLGPCSKGGVRHRTRYILLRPANAGVPCPELEEQTECISHSCMKLQQPTEHTSTDTASIQHWDSCYYCWTEKCCCILSISLIMQRIFVFVTAKLWKRKTCCIYLCSPLVLVFTLLWVYFNGNKGKMKCSRVLELKFEITL